MFKFKGTTLSFNGDHGDLRSARYAETAEEIDVTVSSSDGTVTEVLDVNREIQFNVLGISPVRVGTTGDLTITFPFGSGIGPLSCVCTGFEVQGEVKGAVASDITLKRA